MSKTKHMKISEYFNGLAFYFINNVLSKIPSRRLRGNIYFILSSGKISKKSSIGLGVKFLNIKNIQVGSGTNINSECIIDGRGAMVTIGSNVDIAPQVNIWSLEHNPRSSTHESRSGNVVIEDGCWLANRVIILPGTHLKRNTVVGAGTIVGGEYDESVLLVGSKPQVLGDTFSDERKPIKPIRPFR